MKTDFFERSGFISHRISSVKPSPTIAVAVLARSMKEDGVDIIDMSVGELDFKTPKCICNAAVNAIEEGKTIYTSSYGIEPLRKLIAEYVNDYAGTKFSFKNVCVNSGAKQSLFNIFFSIVNPDDEIIIPKPFWVSYPDMVVLAGGKPVFCDYKKEDYTIDLESLEKAITKKTKAIVFNFPSNPSGSVYSRAQLRQLSDVLLKYPDVAIISDDTYSSFVYDAPFVHLLQEEPLLLNRSIIVNSFSKSFAMTGWRVGYVVADKILIDKISIIQSQTTSCPCSISQYASLEALKSDKGYISDFKKSLKARRDKAFSILSSIDGLDVIMPGGAFYFFLSCNKIIENNLIIKNDNDLAEFLLKKYNVASVPGSAFGVNDHLRISYAIEEKKLIDGCSKIEKACAELLKSKCA